jgi:uncharacterized protein YbjT (DUF2867 family)
MKILLTGATGYIAQKLLPTLLHEGHEVVCCFRDKKKFVPREPETDLISIIEIDFLDKSSLSSIPADIDVAYYLIHSMSSSLSGFQSMEIESATNFMEQMKNTTVRQVVFLSGISNSKELSRHLSSRKLVEEILSKGSYHLTILRAGIIIGSGSASFEIIRDLVEKLPVMVAPKWLNTKCQPIAIQNVVQFLKGVLLNEFTFDKTFDIGGNEILTYRQMLLQYAAVRNLKRRIFIIPLMTPRLSSYWLYFVTSTSYPLAVNLVDSMKVEVICGENNLNKLLNHEMIGYKDAVRMVFATTEPSVTVVTDRTNEESSPKEIAPLPNVPAFGCYKDRRLKKVVDESAVFEKIWSIGGTNGWYYANWLWSLRGYIDYMIGGVGMRRNRDRQKDLVAGDSLDFWQVLIADREKKRLLLYAEMKLPGEAWLEFEISDGMLYQTATFRPLGLKGRIYWYSIWPFHMMIFNGMINKIASIK